MSAQLIVSLVTVVVISAFVLMGGFMGYRVGEKATYGEAARMGALVYVADPKTGKVTRKWTPAWSVTE